MLTPDVVPCEVMGAIGGVLVGLECLGVVLIAVLVLGVFRVFFAVELSSLCELSDVGFSVSVVFA